jgi:phosphoenolpyruvate synthase/pyruvate phosphate dikinase
VPDAVFLSSTLYDLVLQRACADATFQSICERSPIADGEDDETPENIERLFESIEIPARFEARLLRHLETLGPRVAVRSSGTMEDLPGATFAGQYRSFLNLSSTNEVLRAIRRCWASLYSRRVLAYRQIHGLTQDRPLMCVIIQRMVDAVKSGVVFSKDPLERVDGAVMLIESTWGLGEPLVSGRVTPDAYWVRRNDYSLVKRTIGVKAVASYCSRNSGTREEKPSLKRSLSSSLSLGELQKIAKMGASIELYCRAPQDIEWSMDKTTRVFVLQSRDITPAFQRTSAG